MIDLPDYRPHPRRTTYSEFEYAALPPIDRELDGDFAWLLQQPEVPASLGEVDEHDPVPARPPTRAGLDGLVRAFPGRVNVPSSFAAFVSSTGLHRRIRSSTACYLDLGDFAVPVEGGGVLIHFLADQQWVLHWLFFTDGDSEAVVTTQDPFGFEPYSDDPDEPWLYAPTFDPAAHDGVVCAESFSEFVYRFWIENEIWYALRGGRGTLTDEQQRYVEHYRR